MAKVGEVLFGRFHTKNTEEEKSTGVGKYIYNADLR